jgi:hypothetical protein
MEIFNYLKKQDKIDIFIKMTGRPGNMKKRYCPVQNGTYGQPIQNISENHCEHSPAMKFLTPFQPLQHP